MSDEEFRQRLTAELEQLPTAAGDGIDAAVVHERLKAINAFDYFAWMSADAAETIATGFENRVEIELRKEADSELGTAMERIEAATAGWSSPAATAFDDYKDDLTNALQFQYETAATLRGLIEVHRQLILAVRESLIDIVRQTAAALGANAAEQDRQEREALAGAVNASIGVIAGGITGGPAGVVAGVLVGFGQIVGGFLSSNDGGGVDEVLDVMAASLHDLRDSVRRESETFRIGLDRLDDFLTGDQRHLLLPPEVAAPKAGSAAGG